MMGFLYYKAEGEVAGKQYFCLSHIVFKSALPQALLKIVW